MEKCLRETDSHNKILLERFQVWLSEKNDQQFRYHSETVNDLMPLTRWYKESVRNGNGLALEGVWMKGHGLKVTKK